MVPHEAEYCDEFLYLLHLPTKPPGDFFTLADVYHNGTSIRGEFVNLLVAVRDVGIIIWSGEKLNGVMNCNYAAN